MKKEKKYEIVTLCCNCEPRGYLTSWNFIPTKTKGRLSLPFDLSINKINIVLQLLKEDFETYLDGIRFGYKSGKRYYWTNFNDEVIYFHDFPNKINCHKKILQRYSKRIDNFRKMSKEPDFVFFLINLDEELANASYLNELYEVLANYRNNKLFKLLVWDQYCHINHEELNKNIAIVSHHTPENNSMNAWDKTRQKDENFINHDNILKEFIEKSIKDEGFEIEYYKIAFTDRIKYFIKYQLPK